MQLPTQLPTRLPTRLNTIEDYYLATGGGGRGKFALDQIREPSAVAFSVFLLTRRAADSPIMQVRRSTDNDEVQVLADLSLAEPRISLDSPLVGSASTFGDFLGSASGFVFRWFDQSGNARHASQATTGNQPRIANAGVLEVTPEGLPTLVFSSDWIETSATYSGRGFLAAVCGRNTTGNQILLSHIQNALFFSNNVASIGVQGASGRTQYAEVTTSNTFLYSGLSTNETLRRNGQPLTGGVSQALSGLGAGTIRIGDRHSVSSLPFASYASEIIIYPSDLNEVRTVIEQNIAARYGITL
jgi:hypothetical protein